MQTQPVEKADEKAERIEGRRAVIVSERRAEFERAVFGQPKGAQVLVRMERTIISAGTELAIYTGLDPNTRVPGQWATWPFRSGYGGLGRVITAGPDAVYPVGTRLFGIHNHASHAMPDTAKHLCVPVPEELDATKAALTRMGCVALTATRRVQSIGTPLIGARVLVIGLGLVGNLAGQLCRVAGARGGA